MHIYVESSHLRPLLFIYFIYYLLIATKLLVPLDKIKILKAYTLIIKLGI